MCKLVPRSRQFHHKILLSFFSKEQKQSSMDIMYKTESYCQIFTRATQELMQLQQFTHIWICPLLHSGTLGFHFKYTLKLKCHLHLSFILSLLSDHPFMSDHPRSLTVWISMEQALCNVHNIYSVCHMRFSYDFLFRDFSNLTFWQQAKYFAFHGEKQRGDGRKTKP